MTNINKYKKYSFDFPKENELDFKIESISYSDLLAICEQVLNGVCVEVAFCSINKELEYHLIKNDSNWFPESNTAKMYRFIKSYRYMALSSIMRNLHRVACSSSSKSATNAAKMLMDYEEVLRLREKRRELI